MRNKILVSLIGLLSLLGGISLAALFATAFTYQGKLADGGNAASGSYDFRFTLYDVPGGGTVVGGPLTNSAVGVTNGSFTVTLDFGSAPFVGASRWLDIGVRTNGGGAFATLAPRQLLTPTPYAIWAPNAGSAATATTATTANSVAAANVTGTLALTQLPTALVTNNASGVNLTGAFSGNGGGLTNLNATKLIGAISSNNIAAGTISAAMLASVSNWNALTITNPTPAANDYFGNAVAAVGSDRVLIGAQSDDTGASDAGAAYLFSATGTLLTTFTNPTPAVGDNFGSSVAGVGSDRVLIGAPDDGTGAPDTGAAYLFSTNGTLLTTFTNPTPAVADRFGWSVAGVGSDRVLIGAYHYSTGAAGTGAAYLFSTNGTLLTTFTNPTPAAYDYFGYAVAGVGSDRVLIGAYLDDTGANNAGAAYLFSTNGTLLTTFTNPTPAANDSFGSAATAVGSDRVLIGAYQDDTGATDAGAAYLFSTNGTLLATFTNPTPAAIDYFGSAVAGVGSDRVLIGAWQDATAGSAAGAAYLFSTNGTLLTTFTNPAPSSGDYFGYAVTAVGSDRVLIGAYNVDIGANNAGAAYLFVLDAYLPGVIAAGVRAGSVTSASLANGAVTTAALAEGAVTAAKISGTLTASQIPDLDAAKITSGTLADARLSSTVNADTLDGQHGAFYQNAANLNSGTVADARLSSNVALLNGTNVFAGTNRFAGVLQATNVNNQLTGGFSGNGGGLTNVPGTLAWQVVAGPTVGALPNTGYVANNNAAQVSITLPASPNTGDVVRVTGMGAGGWRIAQNAGQSVFLASAAALPPGVSWTARESSRDWTSVASSADGSKLVAVVYNGQIYTSTDSGTNWTARDSSRSWASVASSTDGSKLVAAVSSGQIYTSTDSGTNWTARDSSRVWMAVASSADGSKLVAVVQNGQIYTSTNSGTNWTARGSNRFWWSVASSADGSKLVAVVSGGQIYTSTDSGTNWTARGGSQNWNSVAASADGSKLVAVVQSGQIYTSTDSGTNWTAQGSNQFWQAVAASADGSKVVAVVSGGQIYTSTDSGLTWAARESSRNWASVASSADGNKLVGVVSAGQIYTSIPTSVLPSSTTTVGVGGYLTGGQLTAIELQYIGSGQFMPLSYVGTIFAY
jgi:photosystem II stability/assembly factor-like uncharacterized protein